jgi:demethylmenaquinone methyltransferase / 2-methoxy-6-polyprenyl-1,4-benzoquinol methylase
MATKYYEPGQGRAGKVNDLFAAIASRYDLINDLQSFGLHRLWKRRLVKLARVGPGQRALDLCCGTGDVAFGLARAGAEVVGIDFSDAMLRVARRRFCDSPQTAGPSTSRNSATNRAGDSPSEGPLRLDFLAGDAMAVPFPDASFDAVTVAYGLRNLSDWEAGLREMLRVSKPGGRLLVLDFGKPEQPLWRWLYFAYLRWVVPVFGRLFCGERELYAYILESLQHYPAQQGVAAAMNRLGCLEVRIVRLLGGVMTINSGLKPG